MNLSDHAKEFSRLAEILRRVQAKQAASMAALRDAGPGRYGTAATLETPNAEVSHAAEQPKT